MSAMWKVSAGSESVTVAQEKAIETAGEMFARLGIQPKVERVGEAAANDAAPRAKALKSESQYSDFGAGKQVVDDAAKARIEAQHVALKAGGVAVDASQQLFATGTRMAKMGYDSQAQRAAEHDKKVAFADAAKALATRVENEKREDVVVSAREFGDAIKANGRVTAFGLRVNEQAMRGLCARIESPSLRYLIGLRDRIAATRHELDAAELMPAEERDAAREAFLFEAMRTDRAKIADIIRHECLRNPDVSLKLRTRKAVGDIFATVSPSYTSADAPEVVAQITDKLDADAKGSFAYDPTTTSWELRAHVWTKTPVAEQAVGEAFEGYASFTGRDNGTARFSGGGGITLLRCLNASTYTADGATTSRVHRSNVLVDVDAMLEVAMASVNVLTSAWGTNREHVVGAPKGVSLEEAIPGFWRYLLTDRRSELAGVLPGRSNEHVAKLTTAFYDERRDQEKLVRADFAQGWTRYIQSFATPVRRQAEAAVGDWVVSDKRVGCDLRDDEG